MIHAEVTGLGLIPLPLLGEGLGRLLSLTSAILSTEGGVILVDEIENGIHHSALPGVWRGLAEATAQANAQLIATTHSDECLEAAHAAFADEENYELSVIQLFRLPAGIRGRLLERKHVEAGIEGNIDLR